jgi:hypothetical protein
MREPDFGADGAIRFTGKVKKVSRAPVYHAEVKLTTFNQDGNALTTEIAPTRSIPVSGSTSFEQRTDYYGNEDKASR